MPANITNDDLRSRKTEKALYNAMFTLLNKVNFRKITVKGICEEALVSRAAFYTHFIDKYDLLKRWISDLWPKDIIGNGANGQIDKMANDYIYENMPILKNLICDADNETYAILFDFLLSIMDQNADKNNVAEMHPKNIVISNFYAGGVISYLLWLIKNKFPPGVPPINKHLHQVIRMLQDYQSE